MKIVKRHAVILLCGASALASASVAHGQVAGQVAAPAPAEAGQTEGQAVPPDAAPPASAAPATTSPDPAAKTDMDIIVTGSRTVSNGNNSPTPVTVQSINELRASAPTTIADALNKLPAFGNGRGPTGLSTAGSNNVANNLNLRNFGVQRNLILLDGMRAMPTGQDWTVDVDSLPELLTQRVDIVTGGVSAVYGSDAISGAVNYVLDHKFNGLKMNVEGGISNYGDNASWKVGIAAGHSFMDDKLHIEASYQHYTSDGIGHKTDRSWGRAQWCRGGAGTTASPYYLVSGCSANVGSYSGLVTSGKGAGLEFANNGASLVPFVHGPVVVGTATNGTEINTDGFTASATAIAASLKTDHAFARADYDFGGSIHGFAQGYLAISQNSGQFASAANTPFTFSTNNPYLTPTEVAQLGGPNQTFTYARNFLQIPIIPSAKTTEWVVSAGLDGKLFDSFKWTLAYQHGNTLLKASTQNDVNLLNLAAGFNSTVNPANGQIVCSVTLTNPGLYPGCTPINPFGPGTPASLGAGLVNTYITTLNQMDDVVGTVSGSPFNLPAGPLVTALTGEFRNMRTANNTPYPANAPFNCTGLTANCPAFIYSPATTSVFDKSEHITEVAFEATLPVLKDLPFMRSLEINGAVRYADYSISGHATTWKVGGTWKPVNDLTIRVTRSQDIRAPSLYDLYQPTTTSITTFGATDVHTGVFSNFIVNNQQGNVKLLPEVAQTWTAGAVYKPSWFPRFSVSVDFYDIVMSNAITTLTGNSLYNQICENSGGTSTFCSLIIRPNAFSDHSAANTITGVNGEPLNVAVQSTRGVDIEANYSLPTAMIHQSFKGDLAFRLLASYQPSFVIQSNSTAPAYQEAGYANGTNPLWKVNLSLNYRTQDFSLNLLERFKSGLKPDYIPTDIWSLKGLPPIFYTDVTANYDIGIVGRKVSAFVTVQNLFNRQPRIFATIAGGAINLNAPVVLGDDVIGRAFNFGLRTKF